jgi:hypothetical protein
MYKHRIPLLHTSSHHQRAITRRRGDEQARGIRVRPALRHGKKRRLRRADFCGKGALGGAKDARSDGEARLGGGGGGGRGEDCACEFGASDPGKG